MALPIQISDSVSQWLQYLTTIDHLLVKQKVDYFSTYKRISIKDKNGVNVCHAIEDFDCCTPSMSSLSIIDNNETEIIHLSRGVTCEDCCKCYQEVLEVYSPRGTLIGTVEEIQSWVSKFDIKNRNGDVVLKIKGPRNPTSWFGEDVDFRVLTADRSAEIGKISKQWGGLMRELFTHADCFGVSFPLDLHVHMKAILLGACFLIDYKFFEGRRGHAGG